MDSFMENAPIIGAFLSMITFFSIPCFAEYDIWIPLWVGFVPLGSVWATLIGYCIIGATVDAIKRKVKGN